MRLKLSERRPRILAAAIELANEIGVHDLTYKKIAKQMNDDTTPDLVERCFQIRYLRSRVASDSKYVDPFSNEME